jgi:hypothetical protein
VTQSGHWPELFYNGDARPFAALIKSEIPLGGRWFEEVRDTAPTGGTGHSQYANFGGELFPG